MWMYEESLRLPLLVRYPDNIKPETVNSKIVSISILHLPSLITHKQRLPMISRVVHFVQSLRVKSRPNWRKAHYYHYYGQYDVPAHYGVRTLNHKLIHYYEEDSWELFDMVNDPQELRNIYNQSEQSKVVENMKTMLKEYAKEI